MKLKTIKSLLSLLLALTMVFSFSILPAYADEGENETVEEITDTEDTEEEAAEIVEEGFEEGTELVSVGSSSEIKVRSYGISLASEEGEENVASLTVGGETTNYTSLASAVSAAINATSDSTITLLEDVSIGEHLNFTNTVYTVTLDLNNHELSQSDDFSENYIITVNGLLTIIDNSTEAGGSIVSNNYYGIFVAEDAVLNVLKGSISNEGTAVTYASAIRTQGGTLNMSGGTLTGLYGIDATYTSTVTITGGTITATTIGVGLYNGSTAYINDGEITAQNGVYVSANTDDNLAVVNGGTITGGDLGIYLWRYSSSSGTCSAEINGGTIKSLCTTGYYGYGIYGYSNNASKSTITLNGGNIVGATKYGIYLYYSTVTAPSGSKVHVYGPTAPIYKSTGGVVTLSGGYYSSDVSTLCASGYYCIALSETDEYGCTHEIVNESDTITKDESLAVASVTSGDTTTYYTSFYKAADTAAAGDTLKLLKDVDIGDNSLTLSAAITLDLNGQTLSSTRSSTSYGTLYIKGATVTVTDTSTDKEGKIENTLTSSSSTSYVGVYVYSGGLILNAGTISGGQAVYMYGGSLTVNGGTIKGTARCINSINSSGVTITLNGGTIGGTDCNYGVYASTGTITAPSDSSVYVVGSTASLYVTSTSVKGNLMGGYYSSDVTNYTADGYTCLTLFEAVNNCLYYVASVSDAATNDDSEAVASVKSSSDSTVTKYTTFTAAVSAAGSGDTVTLLQDVNLGVTTYYITKSFTLDLNNHAINKDSTSYSYLMYVKGSGITLTLTDSSSEQGGQIGNPEATSGYGIYLTDYGELIMNAGKVYGGTAIYLYTNASATLNGGTAVGSNHYGLELHSSSSSATVNGGTFDGGMYGIYLYQGALTIPNDEDYKDTDVYVTGDTAAIYFQSANGGVSISISKGYYSTDASMYCADGYSCGEIDKTNGCTWKVGTVSSENAAVSVANGDETTYYGNLAAAASYTNDLETEEDVTITLLRDLYLPYTVTISADITLDLNGYTIQDNSGALKTYLIYLSSGNITIKDSSESKTGEIKNTYSSYNCYAMSVSSGNTLNLEAGYIEGARYGIYASGKININSDDVTVKAVYNKSSYTAYGIYMANANAVVTLNAGKVIGESSSYSYGIYAYRGTLTAPEGSTAVVSGGKGALYASSSGTISIAGGHYSSEVSTSYCADGYEPYTEESGDYVTAGVPYTVTKGNVASVTSSDGTTTTYYTDLAEAFANAADGSTVTLLTDITLNESLGVTLGDSDSVILELNGCTITFAYDDDGCFGGSELTDGAWGFYLASGTLTIQDSSEDSTGGIVTADENTYVDPVGAKGSAVLNIKSGNFSTNSTHEAVVFAAGTAAIYISGGTFTNSADSYDYNSNFSGIILNISNGSEARIYVSGGNFYGESPESGDDSDSSITFVTDGYEATEETDENGNTYYTVVVAESSDNILGISTAEGYTISGEVLSGEGEALMYISIAVSDISSNYTNDAYPTTSLTFTDSNGKEHSYIFAGWYSYDGDSYTVLSYIPTSDDGVTYCAKFVDSYVLDVAAQLPSDASSSDDSTTMRIVSSVDSLDYKEVGFMVSLDGGGSTTASYTTVYTEITGENGVSYKPTYFSSVSMYFFTILMENITSDYFNTEITVVPYWITEDGTKVCGKTGVTTVSKLLSLK